MVTHGIYKRKQLTEDSGQRRCGWKSCRSAIGPDLPELQGSCANLLGQPNAIAKWEPIASNGFFRVPNVAPAYNAVKYYDPIQGHADDCHFIVALSSLAWCKPDKIKKTLEGGLDRFDFYDPSYPPHTDTVKVSENLPKDAAGALIFGTCSPASPSGESWPMVYEKAYALWQKGGGDTPPIGTLAGGNPLTAFQNLTAWKTIGEYETATKDIATVLTDANIVNQDTGKSTWPMAAWTLAGNASAKIYANHSYSILGCHFDGQHQPDYIVMRDPYGGKMPEPIADVDVIRVGIWNGIDLTNTNDGTFALKSGKFKGYFWKFGYVKSP